MVRGGLLLNKDVEPDSELNFVKITAATIRISSVVVDGAAKTR
jgi:hypothetical protein